MAKLYQLPGGRWVCGGKMTKREELELYSASSSNIVGVASGTRETRSAAAREAADTAQKDKDKDK